MADKVAPYGLSGLVTGGSTPKPPSAPSDDFVPDDEFVPDAPAPDHTIQHVQWSPIESAALNAMNFFGAGPALMGEFNKLRFGGTYEQQRDAVRQALEDASAQHPVAALGGKAASLASELAVGGAVGRVAGAGLKAAVPASEALAEAHPVAAALAKGVTAGAAYGGASGAGKAASEGASVGAGALSGAETGALVGGALAGAGTGLVKLARGAAGRIAARRLAKIVTGEAPAVPAVPEQLSQVEADMLRAVEKDPELEKATGQAAKKALPLARSKLEKAGRVLDEHLTELDKKDGGETVGGLSRTIQAQIAKFAKDPSPQAQEAIRQLQNAEDSILRSWAPEMAETLRSPEAANPQVREAILRQLDQKVSSPSLRRYITDLEAAGQDDAAVPLRAHLALRMSQHGNAPGEAIRTYDGLVGIVKALGKRAETESTGGSAAPHALRMLTHRGATAAVATAAAHAASPVASAVDRTAASVPAALARLRGAAAAGNPIATKLLGAGGVAARAPFAATAPVAAGAQMVPAMVQAAGGHQ